MFGVSVRTLHHYDERGLLVPNQRSEAGYRVYGEDDLSRLAEILALRGLGLPLAHIQSLLDRPDADPERALRVRRMALRRQIADLEALDAAIAAALERQRSSGTWSWELHREQPSLPRMSEEELEELMEKYYTAEHLEAFERLGQEAGPEEIAEVERAWAELIPAVRAARDAGIEPADSKAQDLGRRWRELVERTFRRQTELRDAVGAAYQAGAFASEPSLPDQDDFAFIAAVEAARSAS
jgi:DNA-binding transcriptional MerR regulator